MHCYNVLFFCTRNSARSIMAESLLNQYGRGRFRAFSAGLRPKGAVHPLAVATLERHHLPVEGLRSKTWSELAPSAGDLLHFVITVCARAAEDQSPPWPGQPLKAHWTVQDPGSDRHSGSLAERIDAFDHVFCLLEKRIKLFAKLRVEDVDPAILQRDIDSIGLPS
jgi:arsenate reductase